MNSLNNLIPFRLTNLDGCCEPHAKVRVAAPHDLAVRFETIELDDERERVWK